MPPYLISPEPSDLFSPHSRADPPGQPNVPMPHTREPRSSRLDKNTDLYSPSFRGHASNGSPLSHRRLTSPRASGALATVASSLTRSDTHTRLPVPLGVHISPVSPAPHTNTRVHPRVYAPPGHDAVLTRGPAASSSLLPIPRPPPPPRPAAAWGRCCSLGGAAMPLSRYLGKVGHAAPPLLKGGGAPECRTVGRPDLRRKLTIPEDLKSLRLV